jgi:hypothetical protein
MLNASKILGVILLTSILLTPIGTRAVGFAGDNTFFNPGTKEYTSFTIITDECFQEVIVPAGWVPGNQPDSSFRQIDKKTAGFKQKVVVDQATPCGSMGYVGTNAKDYFYNIEQDSFYTIEYTQASPVNNLLTNILFCLINKILYAAGLAILTIIVFMLVRNRKSARHYPNHPADQKRVDDK